MAGRPKRRAKLGKKAFLKAKYENAGDYIRFKAARSKTYGPVRPDLQPIWLGVKSTRSSSSKRSSSKARAATSSRATRSPNGGCSTQGYRGVQSTARLGTSMPGEHGGVGVISLRDVPKRFLATHLRKLPPALRDGQSVKSKHFDGDPNFDNEYGQEYTLKTTCERGRLTTTAGEETLD